MRWLQVSMFALLAWICACSEPRLRTAGEPAELASAVDPLAPIPDASEGLTDASANLMEVLEGGTLRGACTEWQSDPGERRKKLRCGKEMFFYESFGTAGVPADLMRFFMEEFPDELGASFFGMGMVADPTSPDRLPLGLVPGAKLGTVVETLAWTCAACHFGRLPDGRYSVGAANLDYEYGLQVLTVSMVPFLAAPGADLEAHAPEAVGRVRPVLDRLDSDWFLKLKLLRAIAPLLTLGSGGGPSMSLEMERSYARWKPGTMDFLMAPLPVDDGVHTVSRILPLWGLPSEDEIAAFGMPHALLSWGGNVPRTMDFVKGFLFVGGGGAPEWDDERLSPLVEYLQSLRPPQAPVADGSAVSQGEHLFHERGCVGCHGGPRGAGTRVFGFEEIGTDPQIAKWNDPDLDDPALSHGIKAPRLAGLWATKRLLHNGSVEGLEALLCLVPREGVDEPAFGDAGHTFGCEWSVPERQALIAFLRSR